MEEWFCKKKKFGKKKFGFKESDLCSFCETVPETLHHLLFLCSYSRLFLSNFECYWLSLTNERIQLSLQDVVVGIISSQNSSLVSLLNFFYYYRKIVFMGLQKRSHAS